MSVPSPALNEHNDMVYDNPKVASTMVQPQFQQQNRRSLLANFNPSSSSQTQQRPLSNNLTSRTFNQNVNSKSFTINNNSKQSMRQPSQIFRNGSGLNQELQLKQYYNDRNNSDSAFNEEQLDDDFYNVLANNESINGNNDLDYANNINSSDSSGNSHRTNELLIRNPLLSNQHASNSPCNSNLTGSNKTTTSFHTLSDSTRKLQTNSEANANSNNSVLNVKPMNYGDNDYYN